MTSYSNANTSYIVGVKINCLFLAYFEIRGNNENCVN